MGNSVNNCNYFYFSKRYWIHSKSDNIKFASYDGSNEVVDEIFESLRSKYQVNLETSMRRSGSILDSVQLMDYKCHKVNFKRDGSYIDYI